MYASGIRSISHYANRSGTLVHADMKFMLFLGYGFVLPRPETAIGSI